MRKFINNIIKKSFFLACIIVLFLLLYTYKCYIVKSDLHKIAISNSMLLMGDSQIQRLNPELFFLKTYNFSSRSEHFFFTHSKLKEILSTPNHTIQKVLLGVSIHSFSPMFKKTFDTKYIEGKYSFRRFMFFNDFITSNEFSNLSYFFKYNSFFIDGMFRPVEMKGYFESKGKNPNDKIVTTIYNVHFPVDEGNYVAHSQIKYLENIVDLCKVKNIQLVLVSTPMHSNYKVKVNDKYFKILSKAVKNSNCIYYDFLQEKTPANYLSDANHLNIEGAIVYSKKINELLKEQEDNSSKN